MTTLAGRHLVIFGCGYVGAAVARWAATADLRVTALTRNPASAIVLREVGINAVVADLASQSWHDEVAPAPEFAVNCVSSGGGGTEGYRHSYLEGMRSIAAWAATRGEIGTFLYTSSTSVYPQGDGVLVDESANVSATNDRAQVLIDAEARVRSSVGAWKRWFILRLAGIYGPGRHHLLEQVRAGEVAGSGEHHLNLIHRDDIVTAIAACLTAPAAIANQIFNAADDGRERKSQIVTWLAAELGLPPSRFSGAPAGGRRTVTPDRVIANEKLKTMLAWQPRYPTFREGYASLLSH
ncbi:MAG: NAD-dependent epimerase/dehydratase family protein [Opitutaceae bacterium]